MARTVGQKMEARKRGSDLCYREVLMRRTCLIVNRRPALQNKESFIWLGCHSYASVVNKQGNPETNWHGHSGGKVKLERKVQYQDMLDPDP